MSPALSVAPHFTLIDSDALASPTRVGHIAAQTSRRARCKARMGIGFGLFSNDNGRAADGRCHCCTVCSRLLLQPMHIIYDNCCCVFAVLLWQVQGSRDIVRQRRAFYDVMCDTPSCHDGGDFYRLNKKYFAPCTGCGGAFTVYRERCDCTPICLTGIFSCKNLNGSKLKSDGTWTLPKKIGEGSFTGDKSWRDDLK